MSKQVWKCDFCDSIFSEESDAVIHEKMCTHRLGIKECKSCDNYKFKKIGNSPIGSYWCKIESKGCGGGCDKWVTRNTEQNSVLCACEG